MNIDKVSSINFGIKCIKPETWDKEVYAALLKSPLTKEIDKKYPNASASYFLYKENDLVNDEQIYTLLFDLNLTKQKIWNYWLNSHTKDSLPKTLSKELSDLTLEKVETDIIKGINKHRPIKIDIEQAEKNPIKRFFKKFFNF